MDTTPRTVVNVAQPVVAIAGTTDVFPVRRIYCIGRNYAAHAREMGADPTREPPFFFQKPTDAIQVVPPGVTVDHPYPPITKNYHYEIELVACLGKGGRNVTADKALEMVYGYAAGLDMTRRDLQLVARDKGRPWDLGKDIEQGSVCSEVVPMPGVVVESGEIALAVNGVTKQQSDVDKLIWNIREILADLSQFYHLQPGDLIYTGTPEGVGPVVAGDRITGHVAGVGTIALTVGAAE